MSPDIHIPHGTPFTQEQMKRAKFPAKLTSEQIKSWFSNLSVSDFWNTPYGQMCMMDITSNARFYWKTHIYTHYHQYSGKLGDALEVMRRGDHIIAHMKPILHITQTSFAEAQEKRIHHGAVGGARVDEYGQYLRRGTGRSPGRYVPELGKRLMRHGLITKERSIQIGMPADFGDVSIGWHPGVSAAPWQAWMAEFRPVFQRIVREQFHKHFTLYVRSKR